MSAASIRRRLDAQARADRSAIAHEAEGLREHVAALDQRRAGRGEREHARFEAVALLALCRQEAIVPPRQLVQLVAEMLGNPQPTCPDPFDLSNPETRAKVERAVKEGGGLLKNIASAAGISLSTAHQWAKSATFQRLQGRHGRGLPLFFGNSE